AHLSVVADPLWRSEIHYNGSGSYFLVHYGRLRPLPRSRCNENSTAAAVPEP
ncbi:hypothetical protein HAX54_040149, partial [Datura stramonium]|nr:hypothetical protein [Datura stramonium]